MKCPKKCGMNFPLYEKALGVWGVRSLGSLGSLVCVWVGFFGFGGDVL